MKSLYLIDFLIQTLNNFVFSFAISYHLYRIVLLNQHLLETVYAKWNVTKVDKIRVKDGEDDDELTGWEIALIVLGVIVAVILLLLCCFCLCCRRYDRVFSGLFTMLSISN